MERRVAVKRRMRGSHPGFEAVSMAGDGAKAAHRPMDVEKRWDRSLIDLSRSIIEYLETKHT